MKIRNFTTYLNEELDIDDVHEGLNDSYNELKKDIIDLINNTLEGSNEIKDVSKQDLNDFMTEYLSSGKNAEMIDELIGDNDLFNFYLKHQTDFDTLLKDTGYMEKTPQENSVFSLYDIILDGTKQGILTLIKIMQSEIFSE